MALAALPLLAVFTTIHMESVAVRDSSSSMMIAQMASCAPTKFLILSNMRVASKSALTTKFLSLTGAQVPGGVLTTTAQPSNALENSISSVHLKTLAMNLTVACASVTVNL